MSGEYNNLGLTEPLKGQISWYFYTYENLKFHAQLSWARKKFYNLGARTHLYPIALLSPNDSANYNHNKKEHTKNMTKHGTKLDSGVAQGENLTALS